MIKYLSERIATCVCKNDEDADVEVVAYGFDIFLQEAGVILLALLLALPFGLLLPVAVSIVAYKLLRRYAGGTHAAHRIACMITSILVAFGPALVFARTSLRIPLPVLAALCVLDLILLYRYAPADTDTRPVRNPDTRRRMRLIALVTMAAYTVVALALNFWRPDYASLLVTIATAVCCTTHPAAYRLYGCQRPDDPGVDAPSPS